jgi:uncharacterized protein (DUF2126 family)
MEVCVPVLWSVDSYGGKLQLRPVPSFLEEVVAYERMIIVAELLIKGIV